MSAPVVVLKSGRDRSVRNRHPWLFSGGVKEAPKVPAGTVVEVHTNDGERLALGHWQPDSQIVCRLFDFSGTAAEALSADWWLARMERTQRLRHALLDTTSTTAWRMINAEGDGFPGLIVDRYGDLAVFQARTAGMSGLEPLLVQWLQQQGIHHIYRKGEDRDERDTHELGRQSAWLLGGVDEQEFQENGLYFRAYPVAGQKTGFFLDQRDARAQVGHLAKGRTCLNAFGYTGGFAAYALRGGAEKVVSVDISALATEQAHQTMLRNGLADRHEGLTADCFEYLRHMPEDTFDLIVLDPPAFTKHISTVDRAARGYKEINLKAFRRIKSGGILFTFSCSQHMPRDLFRKVVFGAAADAGRSVRLIGQTGHAPDHPVDLYHPEGEYLKGLVLFVD